MNGNGRKANMCSMACARVSVCEYGDMKENRGRRDKIAYAAGNEKT